MIIKGFNFSYLRYGTLKSVKPKSYFYNARCIYLIIYDPTFTADNTIFTCAFYFVSFVCRSVCQNYSPKVTQMFKAKMNIKYSSWYCIKLNIKLKDWSCYFLSFCVKMIAESKPIGYFP